jgi:Chaperone of endosialidase
MKKFIYLNVLIMALVFITNITTAQNVGIGTTTPTNKLHLVAASNPLRIQGIQSGTISDSVLTVDANGVVRQRDAASLGNNVANTCNGARITGTTTQSTAIVGSFVKYTGLSTTSFTKGSIGTSASQITIQKAGYYKVDARLYLFNTSGVTNFVTVGLVGAGSSGYQSLYMPVSSGAHGTVTDIVYANVGDIVTLNIFQNAAGIEMQGGNLEVFQMDCGGGGKDTITLNPTPLSKCYTMQIAGGGQTFTGGTSGGTATILDETSVYVNENTVYNTASNKYICQEAGNYKFTGHFNINPVAATSGYMNASFFKNNLSWLGSAIDEGTTTTYGGAASSVIIPLVVGDQVDFRGYWAGSGSYTINSFQWNATKIGCGTGRDTTVSQLQVSQLTACPAFRSGNTASQATLANGLWQIVDLSYSNFDATTGVNLTTNRFVVSKAGKYSFEGYLSYTNGASAAAITIGIRKNGTTVYIGNGKMMTATEPVSFETTLIDSANANDYYELVIFCNGVAGTISAEPRFSGAMLNCAGDASIASNALEPWYNVATNTPATANTQNIYQLGSVGVGTNNPSQKFEVNGGYARISYQNGIANGPYLDFNHTIAALNQKFRRIGNINGDMTFDKVNDAYTLNTEQMRITSIGNVGIGTTAPAQLLHVSKNQSTPTSIAVSNAGTPSATTTMQFLLSEDGSSDHGHFRRYRDGSGMDELGYTTDLTFVGNVSSTPAERMRITLGGNVGIGTPSSITTLHIKSTGAGLARLQGGDNTTYTEQQLADEANNLKWSVGMNHDVNPTSSLRNTFYIYQYSNKNDVAVNNYRIAIDDNGFVGIGSNVPAFKLDVAGTTACTGNVWTSDLRKKQNVAPFELNASDIIKNLKPVTFDWKNIVDKGMEGKQIGFIAQDIEKILPTMVVTNADSMQSKGVKYNELFPIIVKALQEQQLIIQDLKQEIKTLKNNNPAENQMLNTRVSDIEKVIKDCDLPCTKMINNDPTLIAKLYQNTPNPFTQTTQIAYFLPQILTTAILNIYDLTGKEIASYPVTQVGKGFVIIDGGTLTAGQYMYTLLVDGTEVGTKKMILTK